MKKSDLRSGMIVVTRDGRKGIVLLGTANGNVIGGIGLGHGVSTWMPFDSLTEDLKSLKTASDITAVYVADSNMQYGSTDLDKLGLLWQRPVELVELTIAEIADRFGIDPALIRIKKD
jgi:hypothetical protein